VKGSLTDNGEVAEIVYDITLLAQRSADPNTGKTALIDDTDNLKDACYRNSIGDSRLSTLWQDPGFHQHQQAFYCVRVVEIPHYAGGFSMPSILASSFTMRFPP